MATDRATKTLLAPVVALLALGSMLGCGGTRPSPPATAAAAPAAPDFVDRDWDLVVLVPDTRPPAGRPVTMRFDSGSRRAAGWAGCNRYSAAYTRRGDGLSFGLAAATRMACPDGMGFEQAFFAMLAKVTAGEVTGSTLVLHGADGPLARFEETPSQTP